jgi:peptidoglycan/xylan/chitin deacetylase (PgdA/CDA1 family)
VNRRTLVVATGLAAGALLAGSSPGAVPRSPLVGHEWAQLPTARKVVALTFDCGGDAAGVPAILATLKREHVAATFFVTGHWANAYPPQTRSIAAGFPIGNHTYDHPDLTKLSDAKIRKEIQDAEKTLAQVAGVETRPLFRFPFGARNAHTLAVAGSVGYGSVYWTVDTLGWKGGDAGSASDVVNRALKALRPGEIVLMHVGAAPDGSTLDADALPSLIAAIRAHGYGFATILDSAATYTQIVDDGTRGRFKASAAWRKSSYSPLHLGTAYRYARPGKLADPAQFKVHTPTRARYAVYARWPASGGYNSATGYIVVTASGTRRVRVDQRRDGGIWTYLGYYVLPSGDHYAIRVERSSPAAGYVIADAVKIARR